MSDFNNPFNFDGGGYGQHRNLYQGQNQTSHEDCLSNAKSNSSIDAETFDLFANNMDPRLGGREQQNNGPSAFSGAYENNDLAAADFFPPDDDLFAPFLPELDTDPPDFTLGGFYQTTDVQYQYTGNVASAGGAQMAEPDSGGNPYTSSSSKRNATAGSENGKNASPTRMSMGFPQKSYEQGTSVPMMGQELDSSSSDSSLHQSTPTPSAPPQADASDPIHHTNNTHRARKHLPPPPDIGATPLNAYSNNLAEIETNVDLSTTQNVATQATPVSNSSSIEGLTSNIHTAELSKFPGGARGFLYAIRRQVKPRKGEASVDEFVGNPEHCIAQIKDAIKEMLPSSSLPEWELEDRTNAAMINKFEATLKTLSGCLDTDLYISAVAHHLYDHFIKLVTIGDHFFAVSMPNHSTFKQMDDKWTPLERWAEILQGCRECKTLPVNLVKGGDHAFAELVAEPYSRRQAIYTYAISNEGKKMKREATKAKLTALEAAHTTTATTPESSDMVDVAAQIVAPMKSKTGVKRGPYKKRAAKKFPYKNSDSAMTTEHQDAAAGFQVNTFANAAPSVGTATAAPWAGYPPMLPTSASSGTAGENQASLPGSLSNNFPPASSGNGGPTPAAWFGFPPLDVSIGVKRPAPASSDDEDDAELPSSSKRVAK